MLTKLSSKGQLVIPKAVREALRLQTGTQFHVLTADGKIVLEPVLEPALEALYGRYTGSGLLADLETEHRQEIQDEESLRP